ncbi:MAG: M20/M25/M40 family metallo-hydrolase [Candidatus Abyssubacteria bacterium]
MNTIEWNAVTDEAATYLVNLIKFNTTNPPGNEIDCARYIAELCSKEGIEPMVFESVPGRGNVIARLRGDGSKKPLLLMSHIDVVYADPSRWEVPPFSGEIRDGFIWGRGTLDTKGLTVMHLMAMFLLKRSGARLKRDIIFMANADEETGGKYGAGWVVDNHFDKIQSEFALNEGGVGLRMNGKVMFLCANAEKGMCWAKMHMKGRSGHGSMPHSDNAVLHMARAINRLSSYRAPITVTDTFRRFAAAAAKLDAKARLLKFIDKPALGQIVLRLVKEDFIRVMVQTTITPTVIKGGVKVNIIPDSCDLMLDCRITPGVDREGLERVILKQVGSDRATLEFDIFNAATESPIDTELFACIDRAISALHPGSVVSPQMVSGGTDSRYLRHKGVPAYGFNPVILTREDIVSIHGDNEKISLDNLSLGVRGMHAIVSELCR